jgi:glycosyltransferase involved in cell wall biosynthesis
VTISVITTTYNTPPQVLARTWASLKRQTHTDWQWVIFDDSTNDLVWRQVYGFCADERYSIALYRGHTHSGVIGAVKRQAFMLADGDILVELDHDDELTSDALSEIAAAFTDQQVGFVYSDWCEILPTGESGRYPQGWAFGYGSDYWSEQYGVWVMSAPPVNRTTISHIVSAPNHVRAWRGSLYRQINGHDASLSVADDYDLCVRTVLATQVRHIPKLLYRQHIGSHTAQRQRNALIQQEVARLSTLYAPQLDSHQW